jgi:hypothetical protein
MIIHVNFTNNELTNLNKGIATINKRFPLMSETDIRSVMVQFAVHHSIHMPDDFDSFVTAWVEGDK